MDIRLRRASPDDTPRLARLFLEVRQATFTWRDTSAYRLDDFESETVAEDILIAENEEGTLLGFISVWVPDSFIHHLFVTTSAQGMGVGRRLLEGLIPWLPLPHRLKCAEPNTRARAFYQKLGWVEIGRGESSDGFYRLLEWPSSSGDAQNRIVISAAVEAHPHIPTEPCQVQMTGDILGDSAPSPTVSMPAGRQFFRNTSFDSHEKTPPHVVASPDNCARLATGNSRTIGAPARYRKSNHPPGRSDTAPSRDRHTQRFCSTRTARAGVRPSP